MNEVLKPKAKLPTLKWKPAPLGRRERLMRWFNERNEDIEMRQAYPDFEFRLEVPKGVSLEPVLPVSPFNKGVAVGDIRTMDPVLFRVMPWAQPTSVAVIKEWSTDSFLVAPFSPYAEPATKTELLLKRQDLEGVLCLWNTRTFSRSIIERSWKSNSLTEQEQEDVWEVFRHATTGVELSDRLLAQVGCPIIHPRDPRLKYQEEQTKLFSQVLLVDSR